MGRRERLKGRAYEQHVAREFRRVWPQSKRGIGQARSSDEVPDVDPHPEWWLECKNQKGCSWRGAWVQATKANAGKRPRQLVVTRDTGGPVGGKDFAHLPLQLLLDLLEALEQARKEEERRTLNAYRALGTE